MRKPVRHGRFTGPALLQGPRWKFPTDRSALSLFAGSVTPVMTVALLSRGSGSCCLAVTAAVNTMGSSAGGSTTKTSASGGAGGPWAATESVVEHVIMVVVQNWA